LADLDIKIKDEKSSNEIESGVALKEVIITKLPVANRKSIRKSFPDQINPQIKPNQAKTRVSMAEITEIGNPSTSSRIPSTSSNKRQIIEIEDDPMKKFAVFNLPPSLSIRPALPIQKSNHELTKTNLRMFEEVSQDEVEVEEVTEFFDVDSDKISNNSSKKMKTESISSTSRDSLYSSEATSLAAGEWNQFFKSLMPDLIHMNDRQRRLCQNTIQSTINFFALSSPNH
jgi:hypothetical protein